MNSSLSFLHSTCCNGLQEDIERMSEILKQNPELLTISKSVNQLPSSCIERDLFHLEISLENFVSEYFPLHDAVNNGHLNCVKFLINSGVNVNLKTKDGESAISCANDLNKFNNFEDIVKILLENGAEVNETIQFSDLENSMIFSEISKNKLKNSRLKYSFQNVTFPLNVLNTSVIAGNYNVLKLLLEYGALPEPIIITNKGNKLPYFKTLSEICNGEIPMAKCTRNYHACENLLADSCIIGNKLPITKLLLYYGITPQLYFKSNISISEYSILDDVFKNDSQLETIHLFHKFGANLKITNQLLNLELPKELEMIISNPRSLLECCRVEIRKLLGYNCVKNIEKLQLPKDLSMYLKHE